MRAKKQKIIYWIATRLLTVVVLKDLQGALRTWGEARERNNPRHFEMHRQD